MNITVITGKGGVGKTTTTASLALNCAVRLGNKTAIIDYDGGHSVQQTLGLTDEVIPPNVLWQIPGTSYKNLSICVIEHTGFKDIAHFKQHSLDINLYLAQFSGDLGIVPFADMLQQFFGVPTDVEGAEKFSLLIQMLCQLEEEGFDQVYIDVEPTAGLERLLKKADAMQRSLQNLQKTGWVALKAIGTTWPDIATYLKSDYIKYADRYTNRLIQGVSLIKNAYFLLVCIPQAGPIQQTFVVRKIIEGFGGIVHVCIVNDVRGNPHEEQNILLLQKHRLPIAKVAHSELIHCSEYSAENLLDIAEQINELYDVFY